MKAMNVCTKTPPSRLRTIGAYFFGSSRIAFLMGFGDVLGQYYYHKSNNIQDVNWKRSAEFATIGLCFMGPALTFWGRIMRSWVLQNRATATKQILSDQIYLAPSLNLGFIIMSDLVQFKGHEHIERSLTEKYVSLLKQHYKFWPAVQAFCSFLIQPNYQLSFANIIAIGWFAYISNKYHTYDDINNNNNDNGDNKHNNKEEGGLVEYRKRKWFILI